ncbi:MAG: TonB-dependent receptor domain-containing protein, partial [Bacteroidota bacterium]
LFLKWLEKKGDLNVFGDLQLRNVSYALDGFRNNPTLTIDQQWLFINPKWGVRYTQGRTTAFLSYAVANKEPNRDDFEAGATQTPKAERLSDWELGIEHSTTALRINATLYYMRYRDQLVLTGKINDVGAYTRTNVSNSFRTGLEVEATWTPTSRWSLYHNFTISRNRIIDHTEYWDDYDAGGQQSLLVATAPLAFSPSITAASTLVYRPWTLAEIKLVTRYTGRQFMDNTGRMDRSLNPFLVQDLQWNQTVRLGKIKSVDAIIQINNLWNALYAPNGYTYSYRYNGELVRNNFYYPMAIRNVMAGITINL